MALVDGEGFVHAKQSLLVKLCRFDGRINKVPTAYVVIPSTGDSNCTFPS